MTDHNPLTDPQAGDSVVTCINGVRVTRTVLETTWLTVRCRDSRKNVVQYLWRYEWTDWCRKNNAEVVREKP